MKSKIIFSVFAGLISLITTTGSFAQDTIPIKTLPPVIVTSTTTRVPEKVWKNFKNYFTDAYSPEWYEMNKKYLVKFMTNEETNRALFTKRGNLIYHISYGYEKSLPEDLRKQIKGTYFDYDITRAIKVTEDNRLIWVVNVEDSKNLIIIRLEDGEMEEVNKLKKT